MFRSRKNSRAAAHAANATPSSAAASTAAVQAFLASQASSSNLSSAAAAAALRSHTASPTNPASIQTKRMQRRLSNSSNGSAASRPSLQRQGSSSSMTERTFRDPSPLRKSSPLPDHPPIPPLPQNLPKSRKPSVPRPFSAEPPPRVKSPVSKSSDGRGASLDRGNVKPKNETVPPLPRIKPAKIDTNVKDGPAKRTSINFSRPMSPAQSPPLSPILPANGEIAKPASRTASTSSKTNADKSPRSKITTPIKKKEKISDKIVENGHTKDSSVEKKSPKAVAETASVKDGKQQDSTLASSPKSPEQQATSTVEKGNVSSRPSRSGGKLTKQPSMVREDADGEALAEETAHISSIKTNESPLTKSTKTPNGKALAASDITPASNQALTTPDTSDTTRRRTSLSPGRMARFSAQPVYDLASGIRHEPPIRAASPAKSALKQSPTPRGPSPALGHGDISDNVSVTSDDTTRKRRSVRVSFEDGPIVVGDAAESNVNRSPVLFSPQNKDPASRPQFNFRKKLDDAETDVVITPIPTLPSFGSIRGRNDRHDEDDHKVLYGDEQVRKNLMQMTSSSDHAIGAIVAQDVAGKQTTSDPIPPLVTSVEGSGYQSDSELSDDENHRPSAKSNAPEFLPTISVVPATPGHDIDKENQDGWLPSNTSNPNDKSPVADTPKHEEFNPTMQTQVIDSFPEREAIVEPEPESAQREHDPHAPTIGVIAESLLKQEGEEEEEEEEEGGSDSGDSVYSDAAEDPAALEGDGFGSIDAIVDSPIVSPTVSSFAGLGKNAVRAQDESPSPAERKRIPPDWEATKSYWSGVTESKKTQNDPDLVGIAVTSSLEDREAELPKTEKPIVPEKSVARIQSSTSKPRNSPKASTTQTEESANQVPKKSVLKSTVRQNSNRIPPSDEAPVMKKSMRGPRLQSNGDTSPIRKPMASSLRKDPGTSQTTAPNKMSSPAASGSANMKKPAVRSTQPSLANGSANGNTKRMSTMSTKPAMAAKTLRSAPTITRTMSNGSDSSSSFKRERAREPKQERSYSMKRSMRSAPSQAQSNTSPPPTSRTSLPNRPMSMSGISLRSSMRDNPVTTMRPSSVRVASPNGSFFGRRKKADSKPPMSRTFSDSSAGEVPTTYRSRFADSSDEEDVLTNLTPVRGIPRRTVEEDSTDLDDSDEESRPKPVAAGASSAATNQTSALAAKSMRSPPAPPAVTDLSPMASPDKKRKSFFGALGRKKEKSKIGKPELDSAARRDTPLERTKFERKEINNRVTTPEPTSPAETPLGSPPVSPGPAVRPGKLQRRNTSQRIGSDSWFPPPPIPVDEPVPRRPTTSDGTPQRPTMGSRGVSTTTTYNAEGQALGRTGKKKRFPMLRKAFGLHD